MNRRKKQELLSLLRQYKSSNRKKLNQKKMNVSRYQAKEIKDLRKVLDAQGILYSYAQNIFNNGVYFTFIQHDQLVIGIGSVYSDKCTCYYRKSQQFSEKSAVKCFNKAEKYID